MSAHRYDLKHKIITDSVIKEYKIKITKDNCTRNCDEPDMSIERVYKVKSDYCE